MAALVMSPSNPTATTTSVTSRVSDLISDLERQIKAYIHEQQACDPLHLVDVATTEASLARLPHTCQTDTQPSPRTKQEKISLDLIFDTPECRTETSPVLPGGCQLLRRGATFHRVDRATAEASDLRNRQWERLVESTVETLTARKSCVLASDSGADLSATKTSGITSSSETQTSLGSTQSTTVSGHVMGHQVEAAIPLIHHAEKESLRDTPMLPEPPIRLPPSPPRTTSPTFEACVSEAFAPSSPTRFEDALQLDVGFGKHALEIRKVLAAEESRLSSETQIQSECKAQNKPGRAIVLSSRTKSVSRKSRRKGTVRSANSKKKVITVNAPRAKHWRMGQGVTGLLNGRMFNRLEADEMIDTSMIKHHVLAETPTTAEGPVAGVPAMAGTDLQAEPDREPHDCRVHPAFRPSQDSTCPSVGVSPSSWRDEVDVKSSPVSQITSSEMSQPAQRASTTLPIPVVSPPPVNDNVDDDDVDLWFRSGRPSVRSVSVESMDRRTAAAAAEDLDWTAFQMAISGPTGDYLMGGADEYLEEEIDEDAETLSWFESYGFDSEGRVVSSFADEAGLDGAVCSLDDDWMFAPVELPGLDSQVSSARSSGMTAITDAGTEGRQPWNMSCNLNDLGDYLNFELQHVGLAEPKDVEYYD